MVSNMFFLCQQTPPYFSDMEVTAFSPKVTRLTFRGSAYFIGQQIVLLMTWTLKV